MWLLVGPEVVAPSPHVQPHAVMVPVVAVDAEPSAEQVRSTQLTVNTAWGASGAGVQMSRIGAAVALLPSGGSPKPS